MNTSRILIVLILILIFSNILYTAPVLQNTRDSRNGRIFTPKGDLKVLFIAVRFGEKEDTTIRIEPSIWCPYKSFPESVYSNQTFYTSYADFDTLDTDYSIQANYDRDIKNISRWYYVMSGG